VFSLLRITGNVFTINSSTSPPGDYWLDPTGSGGSLMSGSRKTTRLDLGVVHALELEQGISGKRLFPLVLEEEDVPTEILLGAFFPPPFF